MIIHTSTDKQLQKGKEQYTIYSVGPIYIKIKGGFPRYLLIVFFFINIWFERVVRFYLIDFGQELFVIFSIFIFSIKFVLHLTIVCYIVNCITYCALWASNAVLLF